MSTGIILGLGLITIVLCFYIMLNIPYWLMLWKKRKNVGIQPNKDYYEWVYTSDDGLNKILKLCVFCLYAYGIYVFVLEIWSKYFWNNNSIIFFISLTLMLFWRHKFFRVYIYFDKLKS